MKFLFGDIVVVEHDQIGVVVKTWEHMTGPSKHGFWYEVYVRNYRTIKNYHEDEIARYMVRHKELDEQELMWQWS